MEKGMLFMAFEVGSCLYIGRFYKETGNEIVFVDLSQRSEPRIVAGYGEENVRILDFEVSGDFIYILANVNEIPTVMMMRASG